MKSKFKKFGRRTLRVIAVLLIIGIINKFYQDYAKQKYFKNPIGKIYQVGENKLNINVTGNGAQTIVLISGGSSWSMDWFYIQQELSKKFKVVSYDRAGMGWSTLPTDPDNCNRAMTELDQVMKATNIQPPYILVGASYGGHLARLYAHNNPQNVQCVVLLDARHEIISAKIPNTMKEIEDKGKQINDGAAFIEKIGLIRLLGLIAGEKNKPKALNNIPAELHNTYLNVAFSQNLFKTNDQELNCIKVIDSAVSKCGNLGDIPLVVVSHGQPEIFKNVKSATQENAEKNWQDLQIELTKLSTNSKRIIATKSGHLIQFDEPQLVIQTIEEMAIKK